MCEWCTVFDPLDSTAFPLSMEMYMLARKCLLAIQFFVVGVSNTLIAPKLFIWTLQPIRGAHSLRNFTTFQVLRY